MVAPALLPLAAGVYELGKRWRKRKREGIGLDQMIENLNSQKRQTPPDGIGPPVPEELLPLTGAEFAKQQQIIDHARALEAGKGAGTAMDYLHNALDPSQQTARDMDAATLNKMQLTNSQLQQERPMRQDINGVWRYVDTGEEVFTGVKPDMMLRYGDRRTAQERNFDRYRSLAPDDRADFLSMFRGGQTYPGGGGSRFYIGPDGKPVELIGAEEFGENEGRSAVASAELKRLYEAQLALPESRAQANQTIDIVDTALNHPGFDAAYGMRSLIPAIPGSERSGFEAFRDQGAGKTFLEAYQSLKGGGQITEIEGKKAEQAIARIGDPRQSAESARQAWRDLRDVVLRGLARKEYAATTQYNSQGPVAVPQPNAQPTPQRSPEDILKQYGVE